MLQEHCGPHAYQQGVEHVGLPNKKIIMLSQGCTVMGLITKVLCRETQLGWEAVQHFLSSQDSADTWLGPYNMVSLDISNKASSFNQLINKSNTTPNLTR